MISGHGQTADARRIVAFCLSRSEKKNLGRITVHVAIRLLIFNYIIYRLERIIVVCTRT